MSVYGMLSFVTYYLPLPGGGTTSKPDVGKTRSLYIPDLFSGILSGEPSRSPHEEEEGRNSEAWIKECVYPF